MRSTRRGVAVLGAGAGLLVTGVLAFHPVAALLGVAAVSFYALQRLRFQRLLARAALRAQRRFTGGVCHEDQPLLLEIRVEGVPAGLRASSDPGLPATMELWSPAPAEAGTTSLVRVRARRHGRHVLAPLRVTLEDAGRLFRHEASLAAPAETHVLVARRRLEEARLAARRRPLDASRQDPLGQVLREFEFEGVRDYAGGDRLRDIDWKRTARLGELMTRTYEKDLEATLLLVLDVSRTMRQAHGPEEARVSRAARMCAQLAEMAVRQNHRVGALVVDESRILEEAPPTGSPPLIRGLVSRLARLPIPIEVERRLDVGGFLDERAEDVFLSRLERLHPRTHLGARSFRRVAEHVGRQHRSGSLLVIALTDLESDPRAFVEALAALRASRHAVVCGLLAERPARVAPERLLEETERAYQADLSRDAAAMRLRHAGARVVPLGEDAEALDLFGLTPSPRPARPTSS